MRSAVIAVAIAASLLPTARTASAHSNDKFAATCKVTNASGRATMVVTVSNNFGASITNITPSALLGNASGTATFFVQTAPRPARELLPGKTVDLSWRGRFYGDGYLDVSVEIFADFPDGATGSTGIVNCNRVGIGNPDGEPPTVTPRQDQPTPTNTAVGPPPTNTAARPSRTPISPRPTRTPRLDPTDTPTRPRPTNTNTPVRPTSTWTPVRPTSTPSPKKPTRTPIPDRPTRTPIVRPTRTPTTVFTVVRPTNTPTRVPPTRTPTRIEPSRTPVPERPTRTPQRPPTARPTRTPNVPTATPTYSGPVIGQGLNASCSLRRNSDFVSITMVVDNRTGTDLRDVRGSTLQLDPEGGALFFDRTGPSPTTVPLLRNGVSTTLTWTGRLSPGGTMGFSAFASANSPTGAIQTRLIDCGVTGTSTGSFDPSEFTGECSINPRQDNGTIIVSIRNASNETLSDIEAFFVSKTSTGTAGAFQMRGPAPRAVSAMSPGGARNFEFGANFLGDGTITMRFQARAIRHTDESLNTAVIECTATVGGQGGSLPDLGVNSQELHDSVRVDTEDFGPGSCAVVEGCVDGTGSRKLLRFSTITPNYGPGDVFLGNPIGNPEFVYSACHNHYHFQEYADYRVLDMGGNIVARGHKQAFCLVDLVPPSQTGLSGDARAQFETCNFQGISAGWADNYHSGLDCQWVDITGVPSGRYVLEVHINPARVIREGNYNNNVGRTEIVIP